MCPLRTVYGPLGKSQCGRERPSRNLGGCPDSARFLAQKTRSHQQTPVKSFYTGQSDVLKDPQRAVTASFFFVRNCLTSAGDCLLKAIAAAIPRTPCIWTFMMRQQRHRRAAEHHCYPSGKTGKDGPVQRRIRKSCCVTGNGRTLHHRSARRARLQEVVTIGRRKAGEPLRATGSPPAIQVEPAACLNACEARPGPLPSDSP